MSLPLLPPLVLKVDLKSIESLNSLGSLNKYYLEICKIPTSIDIDILKKEVTEYMEPRKRFYNTTHKNLSIEYDFSEWWTAIASNGKLTGKGNSSIDVVTDLNEGIDVMCTIMNNSQSNEKSLIQNFSCSGDNLDKLFKEKKFDEAVELYKKDLNSKLTNAINTKNLKSIYVLAFITFKMNIYLVCFKYYLDRLNNIKSGGFVSKQEKNIITSGFIDPNYGNVKLYKSKKRLELRLNKDIITSPFCVKIY